MKNEIVIYQSSDGLVKMEALVDTANDTVWATQKAMAQLFGVSVPNISYHFKKIFSSGELDAQTVIKEILITAQSGVRGVSEEKVRYYTYALDTLDAYDHQNLEITDTTLHERFHATYENAMEAIQNLKAKFNESQLFGVEKDKSFHSSIGQIYQTWNGQDLYPSVEEKAAMLLYLVVKNHSFVDGNKRVADGTLVALTLMIAESRMDEMDILVKVEIQKIKEESARLFKVVVGMIVALMVILWVVFIVVTF